MASDATVSGGPCGLESGEPVEGNYFVSTYPPFSCWTAQAVPSVQVRLAQPSTAPLGLYVHVPFCAQRCDYCYYRSYAGRPNADKEDYVDALVEEAAQYRALPAFRDRSVSFVYFGGGTPSLLLERQIRKLLSDLQALFPWDRVEEVTFECAPKSVTPSKLALLRSLGVTRLSLGIQQFDDDVLRANGRTHLVADVERAYQQVRAAGFDVVNLDLMVGMVGETAATFLASVQRSIALAPESVTIYQLEIPANTPLSNSLRSGAVRPALASWPTKRRRLARGFRMLESAGYTVRSAYSAVRDPARHRFLYQDAQYRGADVLGLGVASFSCCGGCQFQNLPHLDAYLERVARRELPLGRAYVLSDEERMRRELILQLKLGSASLAHFQDAFGVDLRARFREELAAMADAGWLRVDGRSIRLTRAGLLRADWLVRHFYLPEHRSIRYA